MEDHTHESSLRKGSEAQGEAISPEVQGATDSMERPMPPEAIAAASQGETPRGDFFSGLGTEGQAPLAATAEPDTQAAGSVAQAAPDETHVGDNTQVFEVRVTNPDEPKQISRRALLKLGVAAGAATLAVPDVINAVQGKPSFTRRLVNFLFPKNSPKTDASTLPKVGSSEMAKAEATTHPATPPEKVALYQQPTPEAPTTAPTENAVVPIPEVVDYQKEAQEKFVIGIIDLKRQFSYLLPKDLADLADIPQTLRNADGSFTVIVDPLPQLGKSLDGEDTEIFNNWEDDKAGQPQDALIIRGSVDTSHNVVMGHSSTSGDNPHLALDWIENIIRKGHGEQAQGMALRMEQNDLDDPQKINLQNVEIVDTRTLPDHQDVMNAFSVYSKNKGQPFFIRSDMLQLPPIAVGDNTITNIACGEASVDGKHPRHLLTIKATP